MANSIDHRLPSFRRVWDHLVQERLRSSTLSVCIFTVAVPAAIFIVDLSFEIFRRKAGVSASEVVGNTLWPTVTSAVISVLAWAMLLGWSFVILVTHDKKALIALIGEKDAYTQQLGEIMGQRAEESANRANQDFGTIYNLQEKMRQIKEQLSLTEEQLYEAKTQLANERDRTSQPDLALVWDWSEDQRKMRELGGQTEKDILVHNRSNQFVYNIQIQTVPLRHDLVFDPISDIGPNMQCKSIGRWNDKSSLTSNYCYFFIEGEEEAQNKGWLCKKTHNRRLSDSFYKIPMAITYESQGIKWHYEFDFTYEQGVQSYFTRKSGRRIS